MSPALPSQSTTPPTPPPLPPQSSYEAHPPNSHFKIAEKVSGFWEKFQHAQGAFYETSDPGLPIDPVAPKIGPYFFYGTLMDPNMLMEILDLKETPMLRRTTIIGYSCKLWGQYPALVNGPQGGIVKGVIYDVQTKEHATKLAEYETRAYMAAPCDISLVDGEEPAKVCGTTFRYIGPNVDLDDGDFDLKTWLRRMERRCC